MQNKNYTLNGLRVIRNVYANGDTVTTNKWYSYQLREVLSHSSYYGPRVNKVNNFSYTIDKEDRGTQHWYIIREWGNPVSRTEYESVGYHKYSNYYPSAPALTQSQKDAVYDQALKRLHKNIRGSDLQLMVDAFEAKTTLRMLKKAVRTLRDVRRFAKRVSKKRKLENGWLEAQYGWLPTIQSLYDLVALEWVRELEFYAHGYSKFETSRSETGGTTNHEGIYAYKKADMTTSHLVRHGCTIKIKSQIADLIDRLISYNPASIAWELMPYSFVVDWFVDIGGYLTARAGAAQYPQLQFSGIYTSTLDITKWENSLVSPFCTEPNAISWGASSTRPGERCLINFDRRANLISLPMPKGVTTSLDLSTGQLLNGIALLKQRFS